MAKIDLTGRLAGSGSTDVMFINNLEVGSGGLRTAGKMPVMSLPTVTAPGASNQTLTAAQLATGLIVQDPGGAATYTTDTAANIISGLPLSNDGDSFMVFLVNLVGGATAITLAAGSNVTISNVGQTVGQNESAILLFRRASSTTVTVYIFGA